MLIQVWKQATIALNLLLNLGITTTMLSAISFGHHSPVQEHACTKITTHYKSKPTYFLKHMSHMTVMVNLDSLTKYLNNLVDYSRINKAPCD